jgi:hypothetical protein
MSRQIINLLMCITIVQLSGCKPNNEDIPDSHMVKRFYDAPRSQLRWDDFEKYNLEEQYQLFVYARLAMHPRIIVPTLLLAKRGGEIVPFLVTKMKIAKTDRLVCSIVEVFFYMSESKVYDVSQSAEVMQAIENRCSAMKTGFWKDQTEEEISRIKALSTTFSNSPLK